ncbi:MAG: thrombospondin type 3 repeat-containing protein, partial [Kiritimatiellae bacterium]|nr:thrombospondin type 3 repeat-containing protein [Kiritimatiellia bacterium]
FNTNNADDATIDSDSDGFSNRDEYTSGTDPTDPASYLKISTADLVNTNDFRLSIWLGPYRQYVINSSDDASGEKTLVGSYLTAGSTEGTNYWIDTNAVIETSHRYYDVSVSYDGYSYTNTEEWALHVQQRTTNEQFLICVPVNFGSTNENNLNSTLGQQLARGLYASASTGLADIARCLSPAGMWNEYYLVTNTQGQTYWWDRDSGTTANVPVTAGMALWIIRRTNTTDRTNTVFGGRSFTAQTVTNFAFTTNKWTLFGWPLAEARQHLRSVAITNEADQLGFYGAGAVGGANFNPEYPEQGGDIMWVWDNNTYKFYWLMDYIGLSYNKRWWDENENNFADFALEPGVAYYYYHSATNLAITNFMWTPQLP